MAGFPAPFVKFREDDSNGLPLAAGKLYSYAAGTSTPLATYTTQALNVPNLNPTVLDASGRAEIWIEDGIGYKFILNDSAGNLIWSVDNVEVPQIEAPSAPQEVPPGGIVMYGGATAPTNWLLCDGSAVSRTTYSALFAIIGTAYGAGNGSTTFNVPDVRQRFPLGKAASGTGVTLGSTGGTIDHTHTGPSHTHTIAAHTHTLSAHTHTVPYSGWTTALNTPPLAGILQAGGSGVGAEASVTQATTTNVSGAPNTPDTAANTAALATDAGGTAVTGTGNPSFVVVNFIIKT